MINGHFFFFSLSSTGTSERFRLRENIIILSSRLARPTPYTVAATARQERARARPNQMWHKINFRHPRRPPRRCRPVGTCLTVYGEIITTLICGGNVYRVRHLSIKKKNRFIRFSRLLCQFNKRTFFSFATDENNNKNF